MAGKVLDRDAGAGGCSGIDEAFELFGAAWMTKFSQGFCLDLSDAFPGDFEVLADFFEGMVAFFSDTKAHAEHFFFSWGQ